MDNDKLINSLEKFSGSLLVTIFAIFAFTSGTILGTNSNCVKWMFLASLGLAILSLVFSYRAISVPINVYVSQDVEQLTGSKSKGRELTIIERKSMVRGVKTQWMLSLASLAMLAASVATYLFTDNTPSVIIKKPVEVMDISDGVDP